MPVFRALRGLGSEWPKVARHEERCHVPGDVDSVVKVVGTPRRTASEGARGSSRAAGHSKRRYRPWFTVCNALDAWLLARAWLGLLPAATMRW
jgi:hypothetical protein